MRNLAFAWMRDAGKFQAMSWTHSVQYQQLVLMTSLAVKSDNSLRAPTGASLLKCSSFQS